MRDAHYFISRVPTYHDEYLNSDFYWHPVSFEFLITVTISHCTSAAVSQRARKPEELARCASPMRKLLANAPFWVFSDIDLVYFGHVLLLSVLTLITLSPG